MSKRINGQRLISLVAFGAGLFAIGCGKEGPAEDDSGAFNLGRCYGTDCAASVQATVGAETEIRDCSEAAVGTVEEELVFQAPASVPSTEKFTVGPDGSVWALSGLGDTDEIVLSHYSAEGVYLGSTEPLAVREPYTSLTSNLSVDSTGQALVAIYSVYAPTADDPLTERLVIHTIAGDLSAAREPLLFRGSGDSLLAGGSGDSFVLAGNGLNNAPHGVLARFTGGEADWVQTAVPTSGLGAGVGVSALALSANGEAAVLAQRSPRWEPGAPDEFRFGIARFDQNGAMLWNLELPSPYAGGFSAGMASTPAGDVVIRGVMPGPSLNQQRVLARLVTSSGTLGWAFRLPGGFDESLAVDSVGRTVVTSFNTVAIISANGESCDQYTLPVPEGALAFARGVVVRGSSFYVDSGSGVRRYRMPAG
ncbi:MAG TPA: hypothetical protein VG937_29415 [Polyangiaceae bacterium]|jgi:hypothetical protein|nr:hypothetical protein [Polyangiaceae bacterium]